MKQLSHLIQCLDRPLVAGPINRPVEHVTMDSRECTANSMFVAVRGTNVDGHSFIPSLSGRGVAAVVCEDLPADPDPEITFIQVENTSHALGRLASEWYDNPSRRLKLVGVTGTNGKTTTATLIYEMARLLGHKAGLLSTVVNYIDDRAMQANCTTPDALTINRLLHEMVEAGCEYASMEVSSHAAHQQRIAGLTFTGGIFSNLTRDHLDYHRTFADYLAAKKSFFDSLPETAWALTNADESHGEVMLQNTRARRYNYSLRSMANFMGRVIEDRLDGMLMTLNGTELETRFTGRFNAYNLTAVYGAASLLGWDNMEILVAMSRLVPVAGRFQTFKSVKRGYTAIVDYAHTPDAVVNVLQAIREVTGDKGEIITVVGAGGNRDKGKRPIMAAEAARLSDRVILTSDNPRFENPVDILHDMEAGLDDDGRRITLSIVDRREAIRTAAALARPGDVILIAGKGHEDYQEIEGVKHHFDDREVISEIIAAE
ncbi:MAG: UDP-N-acetylmuramoyl-L-alanyl-D-glutamate--2,6-diaminopimelate ligase [Muribaculaceae bacterium]|nr:UDP-N-acetylmuramoyl-L-alanyl-D-glutamate--2,6-diaminopimelate ligase [Muribaculaceae bacterium]